MPYPESTVFPSSHTYPGFGTGPPTDWGSELHWALTDLDGNVKSWLTERLPGGSVSVGINDQRTAHVAVPVDSEAAGEVTAFDTALMCWLDKKPIFRGPVIAPRWAGGAALQGGSSGPLTVDIGRRHGWALNTAPRRHHPRSRHYPAGDPRRRFGDTIRPVPPHGETLTFDQQGGGGGGDTLDIAAVDPSCHLEESPTFGELFTELVQLSDDQSGLLSTLVLLADLDAIRFGGAGGRLSGIGTGTLAGPSVSRTRNYSTGQNIWEAMTELADSFDGIDFELEPIVSTDGTMVLLNTFYPQQGSDKTDEVIFEFNLGRHNLGAFAWEPGGGQITNCYAVSGKPTGTLTVSGVDYDVAPMRIARHLPSIAKYGFVGDYESQPEVTDPANLAERAQKIVAARALPIDFVEITPTVERDSEVFGWARRDDGTLQQLGPEAFGAPPKFGPSAEYWLGDTVKVIARQKPGLNLATDVRIIAATITEADETGVVVTELTCAPENVAAADVDVLTTPNSYSVKSVHHGHKRRKHHHRHHHRRHHHDRQGKISDAL